MGILELLNMKKIRKTILIGYGGHSKALLSLIDDKSIFEGYSELKENDDCELNYLGNDDYILKNYSSSKYSVHCAVVYGKDFNLKLRKLILSNYRQYQKTTFIARSAIVNQNTIINEGCEIFEGRIINNSSIGSNTIINTGSIIEHDVKIGDNVFIGPGTIVCGGVNISSNVMIGAGVKIKDDVFICEDVIIGIGSVVIKDITEPGTYVGNPCRKVK